MWRGLEPPAPASPGSRPPGARQRSINARHVLGNPLKYTDPSGHDKLCAADCDEGNWSPSLGVFGVELVNQWDLRFIPDILEAVMAVGVKLSETLGELPWQAFRRVYGITNNDPMRLRWGECPQCAGGGAFTNGPRLISFASMSEGRTDSNLRRRNHVVHELGHAFNQRFNRTLETILEATQKSNRNFPDRQSPPDGKIVGPNYGFASGQNVFSWQQNPSASSSEEFADSFLGWAFDTWETRGDALTVDGKSRQSFMNLHMPAWINSFASPSGD